MKYQLTILDKIATVDDYEEGEQGMGNNFYINEALKGETVKEVIQKACNFVGGDYDGVEKCWSIDIDGDQGRIDFQTMETADGVQASNVEHELWKQGKFQLWACYYTGYIEKLVPVNLTKMEV